MVANRPLSRPGACDAGRLTLASDPGRAHDEVADSEEPVHQRGIGPAVCLTHVQFITKLPESEDTHSGIPWHQDSGYGRLDPPDDLTVFVALTDMDERNGCLQIVPGSHRPGLQEHAPADVNPVLQATRLRGDPLSVPLRAGEALAFSGLLVHGSGPNRGHEPRAAYYVRYCAPWVRMLSEGGRPVLDDPHSWMVAGEAS